MIRLRAALLVVAAVLVVPSAHAQGPAADQVTVTCSLNHPAYSGSCIVDTTATKKVSPTLACGPILACLNEPRCTKTYCNATTIRGGWKLVDAKVKAEEKK